MAVSYVDFRTAPVEGAEYISEFTWVNESQGFLERHHYFVDYPGAKGLERLVVDVLGGSPMVRYSPAVVLRAFVDNVPEGHIVAFRTLKQKHFVFVLLAASNIETKLAFCTFDDVDAGYGEIDAVMETIRRTRTEASSKFGNAL